MPSYTHSHAWPCSLLSQFWHVSHVCWLALGLEPTNAPCFCHAWLLESLSRAGLYSANRRHLYTRGPKNGRVGLGLRRRRESWRELFGKAGNFEKSILSPPLIIIDLTVYCKLYTSIFCQSSYKKKFPFWEVHGEDRKKKVHRKIWEVNDFSFFSLRFAFFILFGSNKNPGRPAVDDLRRK